MGNLRTSAIHHAASVTNVIQVAEQICGEDVRKKKNRAGKSG
jgi:hypothetical protein